MWERELVELLLDLYKERDVLYDTQHPEYLNRTKRANALLEIYERLKDIEPDITLYIIRKKIHTLRSQFIRESKHFESNKSNRNEPLLWCYKQMEFLRPHLFHKKVSESSVMFNKRLRDDAIDMVAALERKGAKRVLGRQPNMLLPSVMVDEEEEEKRTVCEQTAYDSPVTLVDIGAEGEVTLEISPLDDDEQTSTSHNSCRSSVEETLKRTHADAMNDQPTSDKDRLRKEVEARMEEVKRAFVQGEKLDATCEYNRLRNELLEGIAEVKRLVSKRLKVDDQETSDYDWLGQQVVYELQSIKSARIRQDTAWRIQRILRKGILADEALRSQREEYALEDPLLETPSPTSEALEE